MRGFAAGLSLALLMLLGACRAPAAEPASGTPTSTGTPQVHTVEEAWRLPLRPLTQPVIADGTAVLLAADHGELYAVGVDPRTGHERWRDRATTSGVSRLQPLGVLAVSGDDRTMVAFFRPTPHGGKSARLVLVDPQTGKDLRSTPIQDFESAPTLCAGSDGASSDGDHDSALCGNSRPRLDSVAHGYRFDLATGAFTMPESSLPPVASRPVGPHGLIDLGARDPERVGVFRDGKLLFSMPIVAYFPETDTTDAGWRFDEYDDLYVGSLGQRVAAGDSTDLGAVATTGFASETGLIKWSVGGTTYACDGQMLVPAGVPFRCRWEGHLLPATAKFKARYDDLRVTVEGFDPDDGKTTWQVPLGADGPFARGWRIPELVDATTVRFDVAKGVVDLTTGERRTSAPAGFCPQPARYADSTGTFTGDALLGRCRGAMPSVAAVSGLGVASGDVRLVAAPDGLVAYRLK
jgi:outer membrane protein assembly factor BamB